MIQMILEIENLHLKSDSGTFLRTQDQNLQGFFGKLKCEMCVPAAK